VKPLRLRLNAFGPYPGLAEIDFRRLNTGGIFLIHGPTGAGKTSVLDGISFALFGDASGSERSPEKLRSDLASRDVVTEVTFEFKLGRDTYRVLRRPRQLTKKLRGEGMTVSQPRAELYKLDSGADLDLDQSWKLIESQDRRVDDAVIGLLGMSKEQFRQVVLLPQGQFREFLSSTSDKREELLETLFRGERYRLITEKFDERARELLKLVVNGRDRLKNLLQALDVDHLDALTLKKAEAEDRLRTLRSSRTEFETRFRMSQSDLQIARSLDKLSLELEKWNGKKVTHEERRNEYTRARLKLKLFKCAQPVLAQSDRVDLLRNEIKRTDGELKTQNERAQAADQVLKRHLDLQADLGRQAEENSRLELDREKLRELYISAKLLIETTTTHHQAEASLALYLRKLAEEQKQIHVQLTLDIRKAEEAALDSKRVKLDYHHSQAARLALELKENMPCPVCGSTDHPSIAHNLSARPSEKDLELAEERNIQASDRLRSTKLRLENMASEESRLRLALKSDLGDFAEKNLSGVKIVSSQEAFELSRLLDRSASELARLEGEVSEENRDLAALSKRGQQIALKIEEFKKRSASAQNEKDIAAKNSASLTGRLLTLHDQSKHQNDALVAETEKLAALLLLSGLTDLTDAKSKALTESEFAQGELLLKMFEQDESLISSRISELQNELNRVDRSTIGNLPHLESEFEKLDSERLERSSAERSAKDTVEKLNTSESRVQKEERELKELESQYGIIGRLADVAMGKAPNLSRVNFQRYVLASRLEEVLQLTSRRLFEMSRGQFILRRSQSNDDKRKSAGLDLEVEDAFSGSRRPTSSLSGGEGFMASLALALGLSDVVQSHLGGVRLEAVFIDEGFGSLDSDALELALKMLFELSSTQSGRMIGVISHVNELKEQIPHRLHVRKSIQGSQIDWE
jgi:exonuclease SbcC